MTDGQFIPDAHWKRYLRRRLLRWFRDNARDLPWRRSRDPYQVWVSEIMLQQTQVVTVIPYFERFIAQFPDVRTLANADQRQVLRLWEGLGYYRRACQLHAAAQIIEEQHQGKFPSDFEAILDLPGIGRYTAGAIASIAFGARQPILEANTIRVLSRLIAYRDDPRKAAGQKLLWTLAEELLPSKNVAYFNQALMELGSTFCSPREPDCDLCPLRRICQACKLGLQDQIPMPKTKTKYDEVNEAAVIVWNGRRVLLRRCQKDERWAGLWDFPRFAVGANSTNGWAELEAKVKASTGLHIRLEEELLTLKHGVTRFRITLTCFSSRRIGGKLKSNQEVRWVAPADLDAYPLSTTGRKISRKIWR
jgi:A/G-specific adenine glycosylase